MARVKKGSYDAYSKSAVKASKGAIYLGVRTGESYKTLQKKGYLKRGRYDDFVLTEKGQRGVNFLRRHKKF